MSNEFTATETHLLRDRDVANMLALSPVTIRKQRFDRRHGLPHWYTVDQVMIGSVHRYRAADIEHWLLKQCSQQAES